MYRSNFAISRPSNLAGLLALLFALVMTTTIVSAQVPYDTSFSGRLIDSTGAPMSGPVTLNLSIYDAETGGGARFIEEHSGVSLGPGGEFSVLLGAGVSIFGTFDPGLFDDVDRYIEAELIAPVSETLEPRVPIASVPWAMVAQEARSIARDPDVPLTTRYLSIPSSSFTSQYTNSGTLNGWSGNSTGTNRNFGYGGALFAPVNLPHGATVTQFRCGGFDADSGFRVEFKLFRNFPQQSNAELAVVSTSFPDVGFQYLTTSNIAEPTINNAAYNYYVTANAIPFDVGACPGCTVGFCRISYTTDTLL